MVQMQNGNGNLFEFTFLVDDASPLKQVEKALADFNGKKINENPWGKRLLAYPINKKTAAEYYTWIIEMDPHQIVEFKKKLEYDKLVIRYLILTSENPTTTVKKPVVQVEQTSVE